MEAWEGFAVYVAVGALCVLAYTTRALLVERKPLELCTYLWRAITIFFLWPVSFFIA